MLASTKLTHNIQFKFGRIALLLAAALMALLHFSGIFFLDEPVLFTGFAAFNLYSLIVILIPFHRSEKWAWMTTWLLPVGLAIPAAIDPDIRLSYFAVAAVCVLGLLLTRQDFFPKE